MWLAITYVAFVLVFSFWSMIAELIINARRVIKTDAFVAQVQKLIMANNIDRAIKLCNAEPQSPVAENIKSLLCRANQSEKNLKDAAMMATDRLEALRYIPFAVAPVGYVIWLICDLGAAAVLYQVVPVGAAQYGIVGAWIVSRFAVVFGIFLRNARFKHYRGAESAVLKVHSLLVTRKNYAR